MPLKVVFLGVGLAALMVCFVSGCGGGSGGHDVSGKVTFDGAPVPGGKIYFNPDGSKENSGASGYATINNGAYDTSAEGGKPHAGGAMKVAIEGLDPSAKGEQAEGDTSGEETVKVLFPMYETAADLPKETSTMDFDVPAEAANRTDQVEGAATTRAGEP